MANSTVGLIGVLFSGQFTFSHFGFYALAALGGVIAGTFIGLRWLSQLATRLVLDAILIAAGAQLLFL